MNQQHPDEIRADIERTRYNLSNDVDAMAEAALRVLRDRD